MKSKIITQIPTQELSEIAKGAGIVLFGTLLGTGLRYVFEVIVARTLGADLFGLFFLGFAVLKLAEIISTLGLHRGVLRFIALFQGERDDERTKGTIILAVVLTCVVALTIMFLIILTSQFSAARIFKKDGLAPVLKAFALVIPLTSITTILVFSTQGFKIMRYRVFIREIIEPITRIVFVIPLFILGWKLFGALTAFIISIIIGTVLAYYFLRREYPQLIQKNVKPILESRKILGFSWPLFLADFFGLLVIWINILMIGYFQSSQEVGVYSAAHRTALLGQVMLISFNAIFSPIMADLFNKKEYQKLEVLFKIVTKWVFSFSLPICLLMIFLSREILSVFGNNFTEGAACLALLAVAQILNSAIGSSGFLIMMSGRSKVNLINNVIAAGLNIGFNLFLIPKYGIIGAAAAYLISVAVINIIRLIEVNFIFNFHPFRADIRKPLVAGVAASLFFFLTKTWVDIGGVPLLNIVLVSFVYVSVYFFTLYIQRVDEQDRIIFNRIKAKLINSR